MRTKPNKHSDELLDWVHQFGGDAADLPFWQGCAAGEFLLHRCELCQRHYWPASRCVEHGAQAMAWVPASGRGILHTYTIIHRAYLAALQERIPYVVGVVELAEGPYFHANILGCDPSEVIVGMSLRVEMTDHDSGHMIPVFKPA